MTRGKAIPENHIHLSERTVGLGACEWLVRSSATDTREWLRQAPVCEALARKGISHVGVARTGHPYEVVRPRLSGMFVMACTDGVGEVLLDNRWREFGKGLACLAPPRAPNAYRSIEGREWEFVWVRYVQGEEQRAPVVPLAPLLARFAGDPLKAAVMGLHHEAVGGGAPAIVDQWIALIDTYVRKFIEPWREDSRLHGVWERVAVDLRRDWSVQQLAAAAGLSVEQFRRLCLETLGRSPRQQLTWMRMERAAALLSTSEAKLETIARQVGYESEFSFSNAFLRLFDCRPSEYRSRPMAS